MTRPLSYLFSPFRWYPFKWTVQRNDELSGLGSGRTIAAELADPLWMADVIAAPMLNSKAEAMDAKIRALRGPIEPVMMTSPLFRAPQSDPTGDGLGSSIVRINSISANRDAISLKGLPSGYRMSTADKAAFTYGSNPVRYGFIEFSDDAVASAAGVTPEISIFPNLPAGVSSNTILTLKDPACRVFIMPGSYKVGTISGGRTSGGTFQIMQKK